MKNLLAIALFGAMAVTAVPTLAQNAPPTPNPAMRQQFQQMRDQMKQIRTTERSQILSALSAQHKQLLASLIGRMAITVNPDVEGTVRQLNAALSSTEKQAVIGAAENARTKERSLFESMRSQFPNAPGREHGPGGPGGPGRENRAPRTPDAGRILLRLAVPGPGMMGGRPPRF